MNGIRSALIGLAGVVAGGVLMVGGALVGGIPPLSEDAAIAATTAGDLPAFLFYIGVTVAVLAPLRFWLMPLVGYGDSGETN